MNGNRSKGDTFHFSMQKKKSLFHNFKYNFACRIKCRECTMVSFQNIEKKIEKNLTTYLIHNIFMP